MSGTLVEFEGKGKVAYIFESQAEWILRSPLFRKPLRASVRAPSRESAVARLRRDDPCWNDCKYLGRA